MKTVNGVDVFSDLSETLHPKHTALIVVDMQNDMCASNGWMARNGRDIAPIGDMTPRLLRLLEAARQANLKVVFAQQTTLRDNTSDSPAWLYFKTRDGRQRTDYTLDGTWGQGILEAFAPRESEDLVRKFRPSAFHATDLNAILRTAGVESVVVAGVITQGCVLATLLDASFHDYYTVLAEDCVQSYDQAQHENALSFARSRYDVVSGQSIIDAGGWDK
jgi:ureidoacrylate peracid hydrolase